jgi:hypothetical protein
MKENIMTQLKISEIFHQAADIHLYHLPEYFGGFISSDIGYRSEFSCDALNAVFERNEIDRELIDEIHAGMYNLGFNAHYLDSLDTFKDVKDSQGARYMWLKLCAMLAEEQGL